MHRTPRGCSFLSFNAVGAALVICNVRPLDAPPAMKRLLVTSLIVGLVFPALMGLPLLIGVWLPDVISAQEHTLAEQRLASGHTFRVVQYWNRVDFTRPSCASLRQMVALRLTHWMAMTARVGDCLLSLMSSTTQRRLPWEVAVSGR